MYLVCVRMAERGRGRGVKQSLSGNRVCGVEGEVKQHFAIGKLRATNAVSPLSFYNRKAHISQPVSPHS